MAVLGGSGSLPWILFVHSASKLMLGIGTILKGRSLSVCAYKEPCFVAVFCTSILCML